MDVGDILIMLSFIGITYLIVKASNFRRGNGYGRIFKKEYKRFNKKDLVD